MGNVIEAYHRDGFIVPPYRLPEKDIAKLQALTLKLIEENPTLADHHMVGPHVPGSGLAIREVHDQSCRRSDRCAGR